jgi:hypothetical protein
MTRAEILDEYRRIIERMKAETTRYNPLDDLLPCIKVDAHSLTHFVKMAIAEYPYSSGFWGETLALLPIEEWKTIIPVAVEAYVSDPRTEIDLKEVDSSVQTMLDEMLFHDPSVLDSLPDDLFKGLERGAEMFFSNHVGRNKSAENVIDCASSQCPELLEPFFEELYELISENSSYIGLEIFRNARAVQVEFLWPIIIGMGSSPSKKRFAWNALIHTRNSSIMKKCWESRHLIDFQDRFAAQENAALNPEEIETENESFRKLMFHNVGSEMIGNELRQLSLGVPWEILFLENDCRSELSTQQSFHPTFHVEAGDKTIHALFGGESENRCNLCEKQLTYFLRLPSSVSELREQGFPQFLEMCLRCQFSNPRSYARVVDSITTIHLDPQELYSAPSDDDLILKEQKVILVQKGPRWEHRDWGGFGNSLRMGGDPMWVQNAEYPVCHECQRTMPYLLQFEPQFPLENGKQMDYQGNFYLFYCRNCGIHRLGFQIS